MQDLVLQIRRYEDNLWDFYLTLQALKEKDPSLFGELDFSKLRETCGHILELIGETETSPS